MMGVFRAVALRVPERHDLRVELGGDVRVLAGEVAALVGVLAQVVQLRFVEPGTGDVLPFVRPRCQLLQEQHIRFRFRPGNVNHIEGVGVAIDVGG